MEEKVAQTLNPFDSADQIAAAYNRTGIGGAWGERLGGGDSRFASVQAAQNWLQETVINSSRHGIPVSVYVEGLHGGPGGGTIFPAPVNMGNSWNVSLLKSIGAAVAHEARIGGCDRVFAPELQVDTDPRFGRFYESFSEDPHLVSVCGYMMTLGIQGPAAAPDSYLGPANAACEAKHMAVRSSPSGVSRMSALNSNRRAVTGIRQRRQGRRSLRSLRSHVLQQILAAVDPLRQSRRSWGDA